MAKKTKKAAKYVYFFGGGKADGNGQQKPLLGGKGANLHEMTRIGLPVPPGFTITTELCTYYYANKKTYPKILKDQIKTALTKLEEVTGKKFGDREDPLLVSVRSGARESMPGMMDTILNLGLNDQTVEVLGAKASNPRWAWDCYRRKYHIPHEWGTAVNVQTMVFGNLGDTSATGVAFTRDPATGKKVFYGEYLINAQGEDVVAGTRTPLAIANLAKDMPKAYDELEGIRKKLETHFKDMQDFEFTIEDNKLYMLQTRNGKRTGLAAVRCAVEMVEEKLIDWKEAVSRVPADSLTQVLAPLFDRKHRATAPKAGK